ncbi:MAG: DUF971 domain-containing protein [Verrucomicrobia bacterium]|jgi:DUF971 family protein|nr:DUF971 domain-containing protein [Verrucomicrobiota bacterium]
MAALPPPETIDLIGNEVAIRWRDGREDYYPMDKLRALSPSADNMGEADIFGRIHGADPRTEFPGVTVTGHEMIGRYAIRFLFSDGHQTGLFSYQYLREIGDALRGGES